MNKKTTVNHHIMKEINTKALLNKLRLDGPKSRTALAKELFLDGTTVTNIVRDLTAEDLIESLGSDSRGMRGKPQEILRLKSGGRQMIGLALTQESRITGVLSDLAGEISVREHIELPASASTEKVVFSIRKTLSSLYQRADSGRLLGVSVALAGLWREGTKRYIKNVSMKNLKGFGFDDIIPEEIPGDIVYFTGTTPSLAEAEMWFGGLTDPRNILLISLGTGIGFACISDGKLMRGRDYLTGELGHTCVDPAGEKCLCGKNGCLETVASVPAVIKKVSGLKPSKQLSLAEAGDLYKKKDAAAVEVIDAACGAVALSVGNLINIFNPSVVIFRGELLDLGDGVLSGITKRLGDFAMREILRDTVIRRSELPAEDYIPLGATVHFLKKFFLSS